MISTYRDLFSRVGKASRHYGAGFRPTLRRFLHFRYREGFSASEIFSIGLLDPAEPMGRDCGYISKRTLRAIQGRINPPHICRLTEEKSVFYRYCSAHDLPVPRLIGIYADSRFTSPEGHSFSSREAFNLFAGNHLPRDFVLKPARGHYGADFRVMHREGDLYADQEGRKFDLDGLYDLFSRFEGVLILQEWLENHPGVTRFSGSGTLQTIRIPTIVDHRGGVTLLYADLKLVGGRDDGTDNFHFGETGNLLADVDLETGRLGEARTLAENGISPVLHANHPTTGLACSEFEIPFWKETVALARRAASTFLPLKTIGWDIAITPRGPVLIEGNAYWDPFPHRIRERIRA